MMKSQTNKQSNDGTDIKKYINKTSNVQNGRNTETIKLLETFFSNMKSKETVSNSELVTYLIDKGIKFSEKEIKTDLPLFQSPKTSSIESKLVLKEKKDSRFVYTKV